MAIETTYRYMRYGHGRRDIIGQTLKPETLKTWYNLHACNIVSSDLDVMQNLQPAKQMSNQE